MPANTAYLLPSTIAGGRSGNALKLMRLMNFNHRHFQNVVCVKMSCTSHIQPIAS